MDSMYWPRIRGSRTVPTVRKACSHQPRPGATAFLNGISSRVEVCDLAFFTRAIWPRVCSCFLELWTWVSNGLFSEARRLSQGIVRTASFALGRVKKRVGSKPARAPCQLSAAFASSSSSVLARGFAAAPLGGRNFGGVSPGLRSSRSGFTH